MSEHSHRSLEVWQQGSANELSCSRLFSIEPIGMGTPYVISLTSYFANLAQAHSVSPTVLFKEEVYRLLQLKNMNTKKELSNNERSYFLRNTLRWLNGVNNTTQNVTEVLEKLTNQCNLMHLSMLPWKHVISGTGLIRQSLAWCPYCYQDQIKSNQSIYNPLIWSLKDIQICIKHFCLLCEVCDCGSLISINCEIQRPGFCPRCNRFLGKVPNDEKKLFISSDHGEFLEFSTRAIEKIIALSFTLKEKPNKGKLIKGIKVCVELFADGSNYRFASRTNLAKSSINTLFNGTPRLINLLKISFFTGISFEELVSKGEVIVETAPMFYKPSSFRGFRKKHDNEGLLLKLKTLMLHEPPMSLSKIADELHISTNTLKVNFPEHNAQIRSRHHSYTLQRRQNTQNAIRFGLEELLSYSSEIPVSVSAIARVVGETELKAFPYYCKEIAERHKKFLTNRSKERINRLCIIVQEVARNLHQQGIYPSDTAIRKLTKIGIKFKIPEVWAALKAIQQELGYTEH